MEDPATGYPAVCDFEELLRLGGLLDERSTLLEGRTTAAFLAEALLKIRDREGRSVPLTPNRVAAGV